MTTPLPPAKEDMDKDIYIRVRLAPAARRPLTGRVAPYRPALAHCLTKIDDRLTSPGLQREWALAHGRVQRETPP